MKRDIKGLEVIGAYCSGCVFIFFYSGVSPRMISYRCLKGVGFTLQNSGVSLHTHWKDFSDLQTGRQPDKFLIFIQLLLLIWL